MGNRVTNGRIFLSAKKICDDPPFQSQLGVVIAVLEIASPALAVISARGRYSCRMFGQDLLYFTKKIVFFRFFCGYYNALVRQYLPDESDLSCGKAGKTITSVDYLCYVDCFKSHTSNVFLFLAGNKQQPCVCNGWYRCNDPFLDL